MATVPKANYDDGIVSDPVTAATQKGADNYDQENAKSQKEMEARDQQTIEKVKGVAKKVKSALGFASGGKVSQLKKANGIAKRGLTRGKTV